MDRVDRFLCDGMLGSVARWLRLLGFDAAYAGTQLDDTEVLAWAEREGRFLATGDLELVQRALKKGIGALLLKPATKEEQLLLLLMHSGAALDPSRFFTRCSDCGHLLASVPKAEVVAVLPESVRASQDNFWKCPHCGHVYWDGSHVTEIEKKILDLVERLVASGERRPGA